MAVPSTFDSKGRGVSAERSINVGEVVLTDQPVLLLSDRSYPSPLCDYCLHDIHQGRFKGSAGRSRQPIMCSTRFMQAGRQSIPKSQCNFSHV